MSKLNFNQVRAEKFLKVIDPQVHNCYVKSLRKRPAKNILFKKLKEDLENNLKEIDFKRLVEVEQAPANCSEDLEVHFYGSRVACVGELKSKLGIFVDIGGKFGSSYMFSPEDEENFAKIEAALRENSDWLVGQKISEMSVPTLHAVYTPLALTCKISINNGVAVRTSEILAHMFFNVQPAACYLIFFLRRWISDQKFFGLNRYSLTILVLFFLQQQKLMPSIRDVGRGVLKEVVAGWETQFDRKKKSGFFKIERFEKKKYKRIARDFFKFYSTFDFKKVISLYDAEAIELSGYMTIYPKFEPSAISIAGPVNQEMASQQICENDKENFVKLCTFSAAFLLLRFP